MQLCVHILNAVILLALETLGVQYFLLKSGTLDYETAKTSCKTRGLVIAVPRSDKEWSSLQQFMDNNGNIEAWIGLYWNYSAQVFCWADNDTAVVDDQIFPWTPNILEPNCMDNTPENYSKCETNIYGQNCVRIMPDGTIRTMDCTRSYSVVCQSNSTVVSYELTSLATSSAHDFQTILSSSTSSDYCSCPCKSWTDNFSKEEIKVIAIEQVKDIIKEISVDKTTTNAYIRRKSSAEDRRPSSKYLGVLGITIIVSILFLIVFIDCLSFCRILKHINN